MLKDAVCVCFASGVYLYMCKQRENDEMVVADS